MSTTAAPKLHKAKDAWGELKKTRPPPGHDHVSIKYNNFIIIISPPIGCCGGGQKTCSLCICRVALHTNYFLGVVEFSLFVY